MGKEGTAIYVLYPDESGKWRIQAVPESSESFQSRKALPQEWRGLRDEALSQVTGVPGCIFVHASGFIGGQRSP
jgi:urease accessory protein